MQVSLPISRERAETKEEVGVEGNMSFIRVLVHINSRIVSHSFASLHHFVRPLFMHPTCGG